MLSTTEIKRRRTITWWLIYVLDKHQVGVELMCLYVRAGRYASLLLQAECKAHDFILRGTSCF